MTEPRDEMQTSASSFNRQSWAPEEEPARTERLFNSNLAGDSTPLIRKQAKGPWGSGAPGMGSGGSPSAPSSGGVGQSPGASYSMLPPDEGNTQGAYVRRTIFGEVRTCQRLTWVEWLFIVLATVTMAAIAGMSVERFIFIHNNFANITPDGNISAGGGNGSGDNQMTNCLRWSCLNDFTFAILGLVNWLFCVYYCYDGLLRERPFEIIAYGLTIFVISVYVIVNFIVEGEERELVNVIRMVLSVILAPINVVLSVVVQHRMGYLVLNMIGSNNKDLTRAYHSRSLFLTMQKFNIQILTNILVLSWVKDGHFTGLGEKVVLPLLIIYMIVLAYVGWVAVIWEVKPLAMLWIFLASLSFGYYIYKILNVGVHWSYYEEVFTEYYTDGEGAAETRFLYIAILLLFSCALGMLMGAAVSILMFMVMSNFGKGLKERVPPPCFNKESYTPIDHEDN